MGALQPVAIEPLDPHRFRGVVSTADYAGLLELIEQARTVLDRRVVWNVNSTARGGGVVELLQPLIGYCRGIELDARWLVVNARAEFFTVTKRLHNRLHGHEGDGGPLGDREREVYEDALAAAGAELGAMVGPRDIVILHDPQTAGLAEAVRATGAIVIWRCHVGLDEPNHRAREAWAFLRPDVEQAHAFVFSRPAFVWEDLDRDRVAVIQPSIDVFAPKNAQQEPDQTRSILNACGILDGTPAGCPEFQRSAGSRAVVERRVELLPDRALCGEELLVTQVSRWDKLKDPLGVLQGFVDHVATEMEQAHLMLAGPATAAVADDPEGAAVFELVRETWSSLPDEIQRRVHLASLPMDDAEENAAMVNALQRHSSIVVQKSLAEGFGLTVAEAMWKERPVVASRTGGIQEQIVDGESGVLINDPADLESYGASVAALLADEDRRVRLGSSARSRVQHNFLGPHHLGRYFDLISRLL